MTFWAMDLLLGTSRQKLKPEDALPLEPQVQVDQRFIAKTERDSKGTLDGLMEQARGWAKTDVIDENIKDCTKRYKKYGINCSTKVWKSMRKFESAQQAVEAFQATHLSLVAQSIKEEEELLLKHEWELHSQSSNSVQGTRKSDGAQTVGSTRSSVRVTESKRRRAAARHEAYRAQGLAKSAAGSSDDSSSDGGRLQRETEMQVARARKLWTLSCP